VELEHVDAVGLEALERFLSTASRMNGTEKSCGISRWPLRSVPWS